MGFVDLVEGMLEVALFAIDDGKPLPVDSMVGVQFDSVVQVAFRRGKVPVFYRRTCPSMACASGRAGSRFKTRVAA
jgi:hypothetical protein